MFRAFALDINPHPQGEHGGHSRNTPFLLLTLDGYPTSPTITFMDMSTPDSEMISSILKAFMTEGTG